MFYGEPEGTGFEIIDERFRDCLIGHARVERLWTGSRWAEGPVWFAAGRYLLFSDIPNNRIMRYDDTDGSVSVFRQPSNNTNGNTVDHQGRLISCEHLGRRVTRTEHDGSITVLADSYNGKKLNSPNDLVVKSDGSIWFTDPQYGLMWDYEGKRATSENAANVYRLSPSGELTIVADDFDKPNGLAFSPDEAILYIVDSGKPRNLRAFPVNADGKSLGKPKHFANSTVGIFDGFRLDTDGRIWTSAADGVHCYLPDGSLIGKIKIGEIVGNVCFGSHALNRLFICGTTSLYSCFLGINGISPIRGLSR
jgi:gluconolactonase